MKKAISAWFGIQSGLCERMQAIRRAGFEAVLLWSEDSSRLTRGVNRELYNAAVDIGLEIENVHLPFDGVNAIWLDELAGEAYADMLAEAITDCAALGVPRAVVHEQSTCSPPPVSEIGLGRFVRIAELGERLGVTLAFENLRRPDYMDAVVSACGARAAICYDSGHEHCFTPGRDVLREYSGRIAAIHLHDNGGSADEHLLPFDGSIDWRRVADGLAACGYRGALSLEVFCPEESGQSMDEFLREAFARAQRLEYMIKERTKDE